MPSVHPRPGESLADLKPELLTEWDTEANTALGLDPTDLRCGSGKKAWWICSTCATRWEAKVETRATQGKGCPTCGMAKKKANLGYQGPKPGQSLADLHPHLMAEWDAEANEGVDPTALATSSHQKVGWRCGECDHRWVAMVSNRVRNGAGCPKCGHTKKGQSKSLAPHAESLGALRPDLLAEWDDLADPFTIWPVARRHVAWRCGECGNRWSAPVWSRHGGQGCPPCGIKKAALTRSIAVPEASLAARFPEIAAEWHPTLNGDLRPESVKPNRTSKVWWQCSEGHEWEATPNSRVSHGAGCMTCFRTMRVSKPETALGDMLEDAGYVVMRQVGIGERFNADILLPERMIAVEWDGCYWHADLDDRDRRKNALLEAQGWTVIRVREQPLDLIGSLDVSVPHSQVEMAFDLLMGRLDA